MRLLQSLFFVFSLFFAATAPAIATPAKDWSNTVAATPQGAFLIGNPAAKTRIIEYVSYTCPHCAHFVADGTAPLKSGWISKGLVAVEVRNLIRDRFDITAALLARCGGPAKFAGNHETIFRSFDKWIEKIRAYEASPSAMSPDSAPEAIMTDIADKTGLFALLATRNITVDQGKACLANPDAMKMMMAMTKTAIQTDKVTGTPSFLINGKLTAAHDWESLRALLPAPAN